MRHLKFVSLLAVVLLTSGCYHAQITTGETPDTQVIDQKWASGWLFGLVPPSPVDATMQCSNGVAMVETQLSFANQFVSALTGGIFTPMRITVTCAAGSMSVDESIREVWIDAESPTEEQTRQLREASLHAADTGQPFLVRLNAR